MNQKKFHTLNETLLSFDSTERKGFYDYEVVEAINELPEDIRNSRDAQYEILAFSFSENAEKYWGTFYGPKITWKRKDTGEDIYTPDRSQISADAISYWEDRANIVVNPLLKMRYTGLVLDFKKFVTGKQPDFQKNWKGNIISILETVEGDYPEHALSCYYYTKHALDLSVTINDKSLIERSVEAFLTLDKKYATDDDKPGLWARTFEALLKHRDCFSKYENDILQAHIERFDRFEKLAMAEGAQTDIHGHHMQDQAELLAEYYKLTGYVGDIKPLLDRTMNAFRKSFKLRGGMWAQGMIEIMQRLYRKYHLYKEANYLLAEIRQLGEAALKDLSPISISIPIDNALIEQHWNRMLSGTPEEQGLKFLLEYLPRIDNERAIQEKEKEEAPFFDMMRTTTINSKGIPISYLGVGHNSEYQKLIYGIYNRLRMVNSFLHQHIQKLKECGLLTTDYVMNSMFKDSLVILNEQRNILERGFEAFFQEDYLVACHLLIPQFESVIRNVCVTTGGEILRPKSNPEAGNEYKSLEGLLDQDCVKKALGEDIVTYYKVLFTDSSAGNWRNLVCHGLLGADAFNADMADRVFHAFLILSLVKPIEKDEKEGFNSVET